MFEILYQFKPYVVPFCTACAVHIGVVTFYGTGEDHQAEVALKQGYSALELTMTPSAPSIASRAAAQQLDTPNQPVEEQPQQDTHQPAVEEIEPQPPEPQELSPQQPDHFYAMPFDAPQEISTQTTPEPVTKNPAPENEIQSPAEPDNQVQEDRSEQQNTAASDMPVQEPDTGNQQVNTPDSPLQDADLRKKGVETPSEISSQLQVSYPRISRKRGEEGIVYLKVELSAEGTVRNTHIIQSSGYRRLDRAAEEAVRKATFIPAYRHGKPIDSDLDLTIVFKLDGSDS